MRRAEALLLHDVTSTDQDVTAMGKVVVMKLGEIVEVRNTRDGQLLSRNA